MIEVISYPISMNIISKFHPKPPKAYAKMEILTSSTTLPTFPKPSFLSSSKSSLFFSQSSTNALIRSMCLGLRVKTRPNNRPRKGFCCNSLFGLGVPELAVIAGVAFLVFGPKKLPEVGRSFGKTVKSFQQVHSHFSFFSFKFMNF